MRADAVRPARVMTREFPASPPPEGEERRAEAVCKLSGFSKYALQLPAIWEGLASLGLRLSAPAAPTALAS
jgi:hypothetical protein